MRGPRVLFFGVALNIMNNFCLPAADVPPKPLDPVEQVRKSAATAEIHCIGVGGPLHTHLNKITEFKAFITALRAKDKKGPVARVWEMLGKETQDRILDDKYFLELGKANSPLASGLEAFVTSDLHKIVESRPDFYTKEAFKSVLLTQEMKDLIALGDKRTASENAKLNWWLLEKSFPANMPEMPKRFRTVRLQVVGGKDVVLVLSSGTHCRWEVKLLEGAKVTGVILCGKSAEVTGVNAPVVYCCRYEADGITQTRGTRTFSGAYDKNSERFKEFANCVKQITDKDFASFQGAYQPKPGDEPYTIRPSAK